MAISTGPFGAYVTMTSTTSASNKSEIAANFVLLLALIPSGTAATAGSAPHPDFDKVDPAYATLIRAEIAALAANIAAS